MERSPLNAPLWAPGVPTFPTALVKKMLIVGCYCDAGTTESHDMYSTAHGSLFCIDPHGEFSFRSQCMSACQEGFFLLNGTGDTECTPQGTRSSDTV